jgi:hypothetical protein
MTPLHLEMLIHYGTRGVEWKCLSELHQEYRQNLIDDGLLVEESMVSGMNFSLTPKGKFHLHHLCSHTLPISTFAYSKEHDGAPDPR